MKNLFTMCLFMVVTVTTVIAQADTGIHFEHELTWKAVQEKAKKENKFIFVDAFTTWCGPCKMMAKNVFPQKIVGEYFNKHFVSVKVQLDTTKSDNAEVVRWYQDAREIREKYGVRVFPTYLFFSPQGQLVHRVVGAMEGEAFIKKGEAAINPTTQYYTLKQQFDSGNKSATLLKSLALASQEAYDEDNMKTFSNAYMATQTDLFTEENIRFLYQFTNSSSDQGFKLMLEKPAAFDKVLGEGKARNMVKDIIMMEDIYPVIFSRNRTPFKWEELDKNISKKYPGTGAEIVAFAKVFYNQQMGNWEEFAPAVVDYMKKYGHLASPTDLNSFAWAVFQNCPDINCVEQAVNWAKKAAENDNPDFLDTYANLLYKSGKREAAIKAQEYTVAVAKKSGSTNISEFETALEKMKKGEKTW